ncbi:Uncharacterised protein [Escherichia coli]|nr:Uncharacterised protein [Escherichia coli]SQL78093.1 Uncharacterised protein [Escherichia coli]
MFGCPVAKNWTPGVSHANLVLTSYKTYLIKFESCNFQRFPFYLKCEVNRFLARHSIRLVVSVLRTLL